MNKVLTPVLLIPALILMLALGACARESTNAATDANKAANDVPATPDTSTILARWQSGAKTVDFRQLVLGQEMSADLVLTCSGSYGNNGQVNGMQRGNMMLTGTATTGFLMVAHLKYYGASDSNCSDMSKELYSYAVSGDTLTLCALNWDACGTYTRVP